MLQIAVASTGIGRKGTSSVSFSFDASKVVYYKGMRWRTLSYFDLVCLTFIQNVFTFIQKKKRWRRSRLSYVRIWNRSWHICTILMCRWCMPCGKWGSGSEITRNCMMQCIAEAKEKTTTLIVQGKYGSSWSISTNHDFFRTSAD